MFEDPVMQPSENRSNMADVCICRGESTVDAAHLRIFETVARLGSMSRAAAELNTVRGAGESKNRGRQYGKCRRP